MTRLSLAVVLACLSGCVGNRDGFDKPPVVSITVGPGLEFPVTDRAGYYDGSLDTMDCLGGVHSELRRPVEWVRATVAMDHTFVGDLVIKLVSPSGTVVTLMSRPGLDEPADTYHEPNGYSASLHRDFPIRFADGAANDAEQIGSSLGHGEVVCRDDGSCDYAPHPGAGPGASLSLLVGERPGGVWRMCFADGDDNDRGIVDWVEVTVRCR